MAVILADLRVPPEVASPRVFCTTPWKTPPSHWRTSARDFGDTVANLVNGVTKLTKLPRVSRGDQHAEQRRTMATTAADATG
ncbi:MAG: HD domain-containing protein [Desulfobacterales bacterium]|nr:HD domain-containing protein [Desulfobacterales bacterium]